MREVLLCWVGGSDLKGADMEEAWKRGPIRELLHHPDYRNRFDEVHLIYRWTNPMDQESFGRFKARLEAENEASIHTRIGWYEATIESPIHLESIYRESKRVIGEIERGARDTIAWHIHLSPGTSMMQISLAILGCTLHPAKFHQTSDKTRTAETIRVPFSVALIRDELIGAIADLVDDRAGTPAGDEADRRDRAFSRILHGSSRMADLIAEAKRFAEHDEMPIMILGETGTGKELFAQAIHDASPRHAGPFIAFNCANLTPENADSWLFGAMKGSYTGAYKNFQGKVEAADGGTLFLDEFATLGLEVQAKLLRFLDSGAYEPVGYEDATPRRSDVRVIVATNGDMKGLVESGRLREDLYHRVAGGTLTLPPLRERAGDVFLLAEHFLAQANASFREKRKGFAPKAFTEDARRFLGEFGWSGNVRQLRNAIVSACIRAGGKGIDARLLAECAGPVFARG